MEMTDNEIRISYKYAKDKKSQIRILAQLNACSRNRIKMIIFGKDEYKTRIRGAGDVVIDVEAMCEDYKNGVNFSQLSRKYGIPTSAVRRMLMDAGAIQYTTRSEMERLKKMKIKGVKLDKFLKDFGEYFENRVPEDFLETLDFVLNRIVRGRDGTMKKRNSKIFQEYYFSDLSLRELGEKYGISCERVRQIINFVTNRIKFPKNLEILKAGIKNSGNNIDRITLLTAVEDMGLSVRAINSLKRGKINNLKDLLEINSAEDFLIIRGLGKITADEIINKVHSCGFKMRWECEGGAKWRG